MNSVLSGRITKARAQVQTDSLTVTLDLQPFSPPVAHALCRVLGLPDIPDGVSMLPIAFDTFQADVRSQHEALVRSSSDDAFDFAAVLSALLHECRHVHDLRGTRCGAELLLHDLRVYSGVNGLLGDLAAWHCQEPGRYLPLPVVAALDRLAGADPAAIGQLQRAHRARLQVQGWWNVLSNGPTIPGHSIRSLYEALGFSVQIEWLAATFGKDIANDIFDSLRGGTAAAMYLRPAVLISQLCAAKGTCTDIHSHDLSWMIVNALSVSGLDDSFDDQGKATSRHPGTWFQLFARRYAELSGRSDLAADLVAPCAVESVLEEHGIGDFAERHATANAAISHVQQDTLGSFAAGGLSDLERHSEAILVGTEVGADFRETQRVMAVQHQYHTPLGYLQLLVTGALTNVHVRMRNVDGTLCDFRTASHTPSNHVGGARLASESSQLMRLLLCGRRVDGTYFEEAMFRKLKEAPPVGWGLRFRTAS